MDKSVHDMVVATLSELGLPAPADFIQTMLLKDRYFVGWKLRYDGGCAVCLAGGNTIEFYSQAGTLLKTVTLEAGQKAA